jgi:predicted nucleotidyltransferase
MEKIDELRNVCSFIFNDKKSSKIEYVFPFLFSKININGQVIKKKYLFEYIKSIVTKIEKSNYTKIIKERTIDIKTPVNPSNVVRKIEKIYNSSMFFDLIIVGSYANNEFTEISDVDDFIIIKKEALKNKENFEKTHVILSKLNNLFARTDPLQHHGHFIFTEYDLMNYNESIMPLLTLNEGVSIGRPLTLIVRINEELSHLKLEEIMEANIANGIKETNMLFDNKCNLYHLKDLISTISLLPALSLQKKGMIISKKEAIINISISLDTKITRILKWATKMRKQWKKVPNYNTSSLLKLLARFVKNRNIIESLAKKMMIINYKEIDLGDLSKDDFYVFFNSIRK